MPESVIKYLGNQPQMQVLRGLFCSSRPRHIRDLAARYALSPAGVSDIIRRLKIAGVLKEEKQKNRKGYTLDLKTEEAECLREFFSIYRAVCMKERAKRYSVSARAKFEWMDEARSFYRKIKKIQK